MPALAPISPMEFKAILEKHGYRVDYETDYSWGLLNKNASLPVVILPKKGKVVSVEIMMGILDQIKMDDKTYFDLLTQISH